MKKFLTCLIIILIFGGIFSIAIQDVSAKVQENAPTISSLIEFASPSIVYADTTDSLGAPNPPPPPPPIE